MKKFLLPYILPLITSLYPILSLTAHNINEIGLEDTYRSIFLSFLIAILVTSLFTFIFKDKIKASLFATSLLFFFYSYGHLYISITSQDSFLSLLGRHRYLMGSWILLFGLTYYWIFRKLSSPKNLSSSLILIMAISILIPSAQIIDYILNNPSDREVPLLVINPTITQNQSDKPDIYYIILDGYTRQDYLEEAFNLDNTSFLQSLEEKGFYIARCSQTNYSQTKLSLATSLNLNYLETFYDREIEGEIRETGSINYYIENNLVRQILEANNYQIVSIESGWHFTEYEDADYYFTQDFGYYNNGLFKEPLNKFEALLIRTTALSIIPILFPSQTGLLVPDTESPAYTHYERILFILDTLKTVPEINGPKFVLAHIVSPHKPFVFDSNGNFTSEEPSFFVGYANQVNEINKRILEVIDVIQDKSSQPPIIILQGDHGSLVWKESGIEARMSILNAYHLPDNGNELLYPSITPVNTFRLVFDYYFNSNYNLLEDTSFYSTYGKPQDYTIIKDENPNCP